MALNKGHNGNSSVLDTVANASENLVDVFCLNITAIFAHAKDEITECLEKIENDKLLTLRGDIFSKLQDVIPSLTSREMFARRKGKLIAQDIYVIGYSLINNLEHIQLHRILKPEPGNESLVSQNDPPEVSQDEDVTQVYLLLKSAVDSLKQQMTQAEQRIEQLECDKTELMLKTRLLEHRLSHTMITDSAEQSVLSDDDDIQGETQTTRQESGGSQVPVPPDVTAPDSQQQLARRESDEAGGKDTSITAAAECSTNGQGTLNSDKK